MGTKKLIIVILLSLVRCLGDVEAFEKGEIEKAEKELDIYFKKILRDIPQKHLSDLKEVDDPAELVDLDLQTTLWLNVNLFPAGNDMPTFNNLLAGDNDLTAEDRGLILKELFWKKTKGLEYKTGSLIREYQKSRVDQKKPVIEFYPGTKDEIDWRWMLSDPDLKEGILHVGIMKESRRFVCFGQDRGIYLPTGSTLERIRAEIVQDPLSASGIGKSFFRKAKKK